MKRLVLLFVVPFLFAACQAVPTTTPAPTPQASPFPTPLILPTFTPAPFDDPQLLAVKQALKKGFESGDAETLSQTISFSKWAAAIYRQGGTPLIDPPRALTLAQQFIKENTPQVDPARPAYEPLWSIPLGEAKELVYVTPKDGSEPYYAHLYIQHEPSAWRWAGMLTHIPYYDAPTAAQVRAYPTQYEGKEVMYVGAYQPKSNPPAAAGPAPGKAAFVLDTFAGPLWVTLSEAPYAIPPPANADSKAGQPVRVFGTIKLNNGVPYLQTDSVEFIDPNSWAHVNGTIESVDSAARRVNIKPEGGGPSTLQLTETSAITEPNGARGKLSDLKPGQVIDAVGIPQKDGTLLVEQVFISS
jgi:hypothetical protein